MNFSMRRGALSVAAFSLGLTAALASAENWPNWRGPLNNGISSERNIAVEWAPAGEGQAGTNIAWRMNSDTG